MFNFASGPGIWPAEVVEQARDELCDWERTGMSVLEMPFTSDEFKSIAGRARDSLQALLGLPENYRILFMQGGAYAHFALLAMNLMGKKACADYVQTGHWSNRAIIEARRYGQVNIAASSKASGFDRIPAQSDWCLDPAAAYCHITTNETANGVQFHWTPDTGAVPLVADVTSDFLAREIDISHFGMVYASAQKNIGPAGLTLVIIREDLLDQAMDITPAVFNYGYQASNDSRVNTQPTYSLYLASLIFDWILRQGGVAALESVNRQKSRKLYELIDAEDFYFCPVAEEHRSMVNVCFYLRDAPLEALFLEQAEQAGLLHLKGHGAAGGIRASLYNAMPVQGVEALAGFMQSFADAWRDRAASRTDTASR
jgi:phosphoserine aminotransferase